MNSKAMEENIEVDAQIVLAGMRGGMDGIMNWAFLNRSLFATTREVTDRCEWLKKQSKKYIANVSERAAELETA